MFIAAMKTDPNGRVLKYQECATEAEAAAHVATFSDSYPDAFVSPDPGGSFYDWKKTGNVLVLEPRSRPEPQMDEGLLTLLDEINVLRQQAGLPERTVQDIHAAIAARTP